MGSRYPGFLPSSFTVFQCTEAASLIMNSASHVFYYFDVCLHVPVMTAGHYLDKLQQKLSPSYLPVKEQWLHFSVYKIPCIPTDMCSDPWEPQVPRAGQEGMSEDSLHAHGAHLCSLLQPPLTPQWAPNIPTLHVDIWLLLTHSNYLSEIPKCLTVQPAQSRRAAAPQTSHRKLSIPSFPISTPTWMKLFNITPKQSIGKQGWKGRFLLITKTTTRGEKVDFSFKSFCMKGNSVKGEHCCHRKFIVMQDFNTRFTFKILQVWKSLSLHLNPSTSGLTPWIIV